jgi:hypothetical protein
MAYYYGVDSLIIKNKIPNLFTKTGGFSFPRRNLNPNNALENSFREREVYDQLIRGSLDPSEWLNDSLQKYQNVIRSLMYRRIDSLNFLFLIDVIHKYGYPSYQKVGFYSNFIYMVMHVAAYPDKMGTEILREIDSLVNSGDFVEKSNLLVFIDRNSLNSTGKTLAGTYGRKRFELIKDIKSVDSIRFKYNMLRLKEDAEDGGDGPTPKGYVAIPYPAQYFCSSKYNIVDK